MFATCSEYGLYCKALDWAMGPLRYQHTDPPTEYFIPDTVINGWNQQRTAKRLVAHGHWERDDYRHGFRVAYVYHANDPNAIRFRRKRDRERKR